MPHPAPVPQFETLVNLVKDLVGQLAPGKAVAVQRYDEGGLDGDLCATVSAGGARGGAGGARCRGIMQSSWAAGSQLGGRQPVGCSPWAVVRLWGRRRRSWGLSSSMAVGRSGSRHDGTRERGVPSQAASWRWSGRRPKS